jgi:hypothetical protein
MRRREQRGRRMALTHIAKRPRNWLTRKTPADARQGTTMQKTVSLYSKVPTILFLLMFALLGHPTPTLSADSCQTPAVSSWSEVEREICTYHICLGLDSDLSGKQNAARKITTRFLQAILFTDPWRNAILAKGVHITGALFEEQLDLENVQVEPRSDS